MRGTEVVLLLYHCIDVLYCRVELVDFFCKYGDSLRPITNTVEYSSELADCLKALNAEGNRSKDGASDIHNLCMSALDVYLP